MFLDAEAPDTAGWLVDIANGIPGEVLDAAVLAHVLCAPSRTLSDMYELADHLKMPVALSGELGWLNQGIIRLGRRRQA